MKNFWHEIKLWDKRWDYKLTVFSKDGRSWRFLILIKAFTLLCIFLVLLYYSHRCF